MVYFLVAFFISLIFYNLQLHFYFIFFNIYFYTTTAHSMQLITLPFHNWVVSVCILTQIHYDKNFGSHDWRWIQPLIWLYWAAGSFAYLQSIWTQQHALHKWGVGFIILSVNSSSSHLTYIPASFKLIICLLFRVTVWKSVTLQVSMGQ